MALKYTKAKDAQTAISAIACLSGLLRFDAFYTRCLARFKTMLHHATKPFIRYQAAEKLIQSLDIMSIVHTVPSIATDTLKEVDWVADAEGDYFKSKAVQVHDALAHLLD